MSGYKNRRKETNAPVIGAFGRRACDSSGYAVFSEGEAGAIHLIAHHLLDFNELSRGHQILGDWLAKRDGSGSRWIHLQWHMAVFEVSLGHWQSAFARFRKHILPAVLTSYDALTDGPALLWRLSLEAGKHHSLPWESVRNRALLSLQQSSSPLVSAHNILALAGAGDTESLDNWIQHNMQTKASGATAPLMRIARGLRSYVSGRYADAAGELEGVTEQVSRIGGSRAQNELFTRLHGAACCKATGACPEYARAA